MAVASSWTGYSRIQMVPGLKTFSSFQSDQPMGVSYGASPRTTSMLVVQSWQILKQHSRPRLHSKLVSVKTRKPNIWPNILSSLGPMRLLIQQPYPLSLGPLQQPNSLLSSSFPFPQPSLFIASTCFLARGGILRLAQQSPSLSAVSHQTPWSQLEGGVYGDNPG